MEFKDPYAFSMVVSTSVDIGTEWNLKDGTKLKIAATCIVDIGTEWNLKAEMANITNIWYSLI